MTVLMCSVCLDTVLRLWGAYPDETTFMQYVHRSAWDHLDHEPVPYAAVDEDTAATMAAHA